MKPMTVSEIETAAEAARIHVSTQEAHLAAARADYEANVGTAPDDELEDIEAEIAYHVGTVARAHARHAALCADLEAAKAAEQATAGNEAKANGDKLATALRAEIEAFSRQAAKLAGMADQIERINAEVSAAYGLAKHHGVTAPYLALAVPSFDAAWGALKRVSNAPAHSWKG